MPIIETIKANVKQATPRWFRKLKRVFNVGLIPVTMVTIKGLWVGDDAQLNKVLLIITITLPGLLEVIGLCLADPPLNDEE
jgi:hypothetical protein